MSQQLKPIAPPPTDLDTILATESALTLLPHFTVTDAWSLGTHLRTRLLAHPAPVVISITLANSAQLLFHACTHTGVAPDSDVWVARKRATVLRWGRSSWYMSCQFARDEAAFARTYGMGPERAGTYAIHGGGVPVRVRGVEGVVAVVVVSGLRQEEDHAVIMEALGEVFGGEGGEGEEGGKA